MSKQNLFLFTHAYPFYPGEQFIENEIEYLCTSFNVIIVPNTMEGEARKLPEGCTVDLDLALAKGRYSKLKRLLISVFSFYWLKNSFNLKSITSQIMEVLGVSFNSYITTKLLRKKYHNLFRDGSILYSYWIVPQGLSLSHLKRKYKKSLFISRAHGFDLYHERRPYNYIPFQKEIIKKLDFIYPCSKNGVDYLIEKYRKSKNKIFPQYLGVSYNNIENSYVINKEFRVLTVSALIKIKRVDLICNALVSFCKLHPEIELIWDHIGSGSEYNNIQKILISSPDNMVVNFHNQLTNAEVMDYYNLNCNHIDCFINLSEFEGLPVSVMEALSYSLPVILCDSGSMEEQVIHLSNGYFLKHNPSIKEIISALEFIIKSKSNSKIFSLRQKSREIFFNKFSADKNYSKFCDIIEERLAEHKGENVE